MKYPIKHLKTFIKIFIQKDEKDNIIEKEIFSKEEIYLPEGNYITTIYFKNLIYSSLIIEIKQKEENEENNEKSKENEKSNEESNEKLNDKIKLVLILFQLEDNG